MCGQTEWRTVEEGRLNMGLEAVSDLLHRAVMDEAGPCDAVVWI